MVSLGRMWQDHCHIPLATRAGNCLHCATASHASARYGWCPRGTWQHPGQSGETWRGMRGAEPTNWPWVWSAEQKHSGDGCGQHILGCGCWYRQIWGGMAAAGGEDVSQEGLRWAQSSLRRRVRPCSPQHPAWPIWNKQALFPVAPPQSNPRPKPQQAQAGMLQEQNKSLSFPSYNPGPDVKQQRDASGPEHTAQDQHRRASALLHLQTHPKTQSISEQEPCPAAEIDLLHLPCCQQCLSLAGKPAHRKAQPLRCAPPASLLQGCRIRPSEPGFPGG